MIYVIELGTFNDNFSCVNDTVHLDSVTIPNPSDTELQAKGTVSISIMIAHYCFITFVHIE